MKSKKESDSIRAYNSWKAYSGSAVGREAAAWTTVQLCLNGTATEEEYNSLDACYASYDGTFTYVGPSFGPYKITGPNALKAWNRVRTAL